MHHHCKEKSYQCLANTSDSWLRLSNTFTLINNSYSASHDNWCTGTLLNRIIAAQCGGDGGCRVGEVRAGTTSTHARPSRVLSYSNCQGSTDSISTSEFSGLINSTLTELSYSQTHWLHPAALVSTGFISFSANGLPVQCFIHRVCRKGYISSN